MGYQAGPRLRHVWYWTCYCCGEMLPHNWTYRWPQDHKEALFGQIFQLQTAGPEVLLPGRHWQRLCQVVRPVPRHDPRQVVQVLQQVLQLQRVCQILQSEEHQGCLCGDLHQMLNTTKLTTYSINWRNKLT